MSSGADKLQHGFAFCYGLLTFKPSRVCVRGKSDFYFNSVKWATSYAPPFHVNRIIKCGGSVHFKLS
jgi:hypothetical protein